MKEITPPNEQYHSLIETVLGAQTHEDRQLLSDTLATLEPAQMAHLLECVPEAQRSELWELVPEHACGEVLADLGDVARRSLVEDLDQTAVVDAAVSLDTPELAEVIETLPNEIGDAIRESLDYQDLSELQAALAFSEGTAGRLMDTRAVSVRADISLETVLRYLRRRESLPDHTLGLMVVDREGQFLGELPLSALLTQQPEMLVSEVMDANALRVHPNMPEQDLAALFRDHDLVSIAVVDDNSRLIGRVTLADMVDVMREEADHHIYGAVGLDEEEDLFAPVLPSARRRALWLGINLATAFLAAWVIGLFEATLQKVVALAVLMPIVASMGGIAGSQTLTLIIRGIALGKISSANARLLAYKEVLIAVINGLVWALVVGVISYLWFSDPRISTVLGVAMVTNLFAAALSGVMIPLTMRRMGIDPALAGSVVLTTVTDVVGFMSFLGLATIFLL